jgi:5-formyltetrahydrofolate cyclo-ligase
MNGGKAAEEKRRIRARLGAVRRALAPEDVLLRGARAQARLMATPQFRAARTVALYAALPGEVPTDALLAAALADKKTVVFPVVPNEGRLLTFRAVENSAHLIPGGRFAIREPPDVRPSVALETIDLFVVPGVAFTRHGHRLGQGAGYYDATLARAPSSAPRMALTFSEQVLEALPVVETDVPVHFVVTEDEAFAATGGGPTVVGARSP